MEKRTQIASEIIAFLKTSGVTATELARVSGVASPIISHLRTGKRYDVVSRHADALRDAMQRLSPPQEPVQ